MKIFRTRTFTWWEIGVLKVCLISLGILLGLYFYNYLTGLIFLWWVLFILGALYFLFRLLRTGE